MDRVGELGHRSGSDHDDHLDDGGNEQHGEGHLDGTNATLVALESVVDGVCGVVAVGPEDLLRDAPQPAAVFVVVCGRLMMVVVRVVRLIGVLAGRLVAGHAVLAAPW